MLGIDEFVEEELDWGDFKAIRECVVSDIRVVSWRSKAGSGFGF